MHMFLLILRQRAREEYVNRSTGREGEGTGHREEGLQGCRCRFLRGVGSRRPSKMLSYLFLDGIV